MTMSASRKLQAEVDRTLKKVEEGVADFDSTWDKVYSAGQQNLKEKYEADLKKEIKKLQRLRDIIKGWISSNEIKEKGELLSARRLIETKMEQFKICEKETKTKAYSREGLAREERQDDPEEADREDKRNWVTSIIEKLNEIIESEESDIEKLSNIKGKNKNKEQIDRLESRIQKNKWHITKLEQVYKLLDNHSLEPSKVDLVKDNIDYYVEMAGDESGPIDDEDSSNYYEDLNLDSIDKGNRSDDEEWASEQQESGHQEDKASNDNSDNKNSDVAANEDDKSHPAEAPAVVKPTTVKKPLPSSNVLSLPIASSNPAKTVPKAPTSSVPSTTTTSTAKIVSPALAPKVPTNTTNTKSTGPVTVPATTPTTASQPKTIAQVPTTSAPAKSTTPPQPPLQESKKAFVDQLQLKKIDTKESVSTATTSWAAATAHQKNPQTTTGVNTQPASISNSISSSSNQTNYEVSESQVGTSAQSMATHEHPVNPQSAGVSEISHLPPGINQPSNALQQQATGNTQQQQTASVQSQKALESQSFLNMLKMNIAFCPPATEMSEKQKSYTPRNPYIVHSSFPSQPAVILENPAIFEKLPLDTLFLAFYYQQGTYQQYLAAKQLKKHSWRFHKKYMTWFQRHEDPKVSSDDYEEGTYVYFDYESGWCQRLKADFKFEYAYLEDELNGANH